MDITSLTEELLQLPCLSDETRSYLCACKVYNIQSVADWCEGSIPQLLQYMDIELPFDATRVLFHQAYECEAHGVRFTCFPRLVEGYVVFDVCGRVSVQYSVNGSAPVERKGSYAYFFSSVMEIDQPSQVTVFDPREGSFPASSIPAETLMMLRGKAGEASIVSSYALDILANARAEVVRLPSPRPPKSLLRRKNLPRIDHHVITIDPSRLRAIYEQPGPGTGIRHRQHDVRGFFRRLQSGRVVPVRPHRRGDAGLGVISSSYELRLGSSVQKAAVL